MRRRVMLVALGAAVSGLLGATVGTADKPAAPRPTAQSPSPGAVPTIYRVRAGDTLSAIASRHGVTIPALVAANRLAGAQAPLGIGQRLVIPTRSAVVQRGKRSRRAAASGVIPTPPRTLVLAVPDFGQLAPLFTWPLEGELSSMFGRRKIGWHRGIDIRADLGAPVTASAPGVVIASAWEGRYGRVVKVEHLNGFVTVYAHNDQNLVEVGDRVSPGQVIAAVGRTGRATAHHLHFEIRQAGLAYNPLYLLPLPPRVMLIEDNDDGDPHDADE